MNDKTGNTKETEILTSGGATVEIQRGSKHTHIELNILHPANDDQLSDEELLSQIRAAFEAPTRGSRWRETLDRINLTHKLLDKIKPNFVSSEVGDETNDPAFLRSISRILNECSRVVLPRLAFDLDARQMEVESTLEGIRLDNEAENEHCQIDSLPMSPALPVSPRAVNPDTSNTNLPQSSGDGQTEKSDKPRTKLPPSLMERLKAYKFTGTNGLRTDPPPTSSEHTAK